MLSRVFLIAVCALAVLMAESVLWAGGEDDVAALIAQLGADTYQQREAAGEQLLQVGERALPALRQAARTSEDLEIRYRAKLLVDRVMLGACTSGATGMRLVLIDAGEFTMGSPTNETNRRDDERQHQVRINSAFLLGTCEVTQSEYRQVMHREPSWFSADGEGRAKVAGKSTGRFPVESVTWFDALEFCNRLSKLDGRGPYYHLDSVKFRKGKIVAAQVQVLGGFGYRLPTEAEWEYACRAGSSGPYHAVTGKSKLRGNYQYRQTVLYGSRTKIGGLGRSNVVGSYTPNEWGLYDMHGNVAEWCWDWYDKGYYAASPAGDPRGPKTGNHRVLRGGSWLVQQSSCRSATRFWHVPAEGAYFVGFRVARDATPNLISDQQRRDNPSR